MTAHAADYTQAREGSVSGLKQPRQLLAIAAVLSSMTLVVLDASMVHVALPTLGHAFQVTPGHAVLAVTAYQAALVMALLPLAALGEWLGYRKVFASGVGLFTLASLLCAAAPNLPCLLAARFVQGLGGAAVMALGVALLRFSVAPEELGKAIGWNALSVALSSAAGPALGSMILVAAGWRWLFLINLPIGIGVLLASRALPTAIGRAGPLDRTSTGLNAVMFGSLIIGAELLTTSPVIAAALLVVTVLAAFLLTKREIAKDVPLIPLDLLRQRSFRTSVVASVCCFAGQTTGLVALSFFLQQQFGKPVLAAGMYLTAWPLSVAAMAPIAGRLADRFSTRLLCVTGATGLAMGMTVLAFLPFGGNLPVNVIVGAVLCGAGFGIFQTANNRNMFLSAPAGRSGAAGGMQGTARLTGQTAGAVLVAALFDIGAVSVVPSVAFGLGIVVALGAALVSASGLEPRGPENPI